MPGRTIQVAVAGNSPVESFVLPPNLAPFVDAVFVEIDNTAGADATPILSYAGPGNRTVAQKGQTAVVPAGDTGSATWALRLADDGGGAAAQTGFEVLSNSPGETVNAASSKVLAWTHISDDVLLDLTVPTSPTVIADGVYTFTVDMGVQANPGPFVAGRVFSAILAILPPFLVRGVAQQFPWSTLGPTNNECSVSITVPCAAGTLVQFTATNTQANAGAFTFVAYVQRLA